LWSPSRGAKLLTVQEHRRYTRVAATWPVTVRIGDQTLRLQTVNLSAHGVKVGLDSALPPVGTSAHLRLEPPDAPPVDVEAIVWRADDDGSAFFFVGSSHVAA
jgi:c-di-GMP-binding flagellar brake protein YcgR